MRYLTLIALAVAMATSACTSTDETTEETSMEESAEAGVIQATGTVRFIDVEGGFYGILGDDGTRYDPSGLPEAFQEDGLRVRFRAEPREGVMTTRMWGEVVRLIEIERM